MDQTNTANQEQQTSGDGEQETKETLNVTEATSETKAKEATQEKEEKAKKVEITQAELDRLRGELKAAKRAEEERDRKLKLAEEQRLADEGKFKELAEQTKAELEALKKEATERDQQEQARKVAERLRFRDPDMAYRLLDSETDMEDPADIERSFKRLADDAPYLLRGEKERTGASFKAGETRLTRDQAKEKLKKSGRELAAMTEDEFDSLTKAATG